MKFRIPFNRQSFLGPEGDYVREAMASRRTSGDGPFTKRCEKTIEQRLGVQRALLTTSCTSALEMAAILCDLQAGDEVILPSYTFVSTANAIVLRGAKPVFVDIRRDTLNLDERLVEAAITPRTKAIWPVHYAGVACAMDEIQAIANRHSLTVVEDAAQGVCAKYRNRWLGTIGDLGCYSFHETKNISCGEGGALLVNQPRFTQRAEVVREKGTNRSQFIRGQVDKYTWVDIGSSYVPSDILAAYLLGQLEGMDVITAGRRRIFDTYYRLLQPLREEGAVELPYLPADCTSNYHMFYLQVADDKVRAALLEHLIRAGIQATFHYVPLHLSPVGRRFAAKSSALPVTEDVAGRLLRLPLYYDMSEDDVADVADEITRFFARQR